MRMDKKFLRYSGLDAACTLQAHGEFFHNIDPKFRVAYDMTMDIFPVLMFMQQRGIKVDLGALEETKVDVLKSVAEKKEELNSLCGREVNPNSSKQCKEYFYDELGIPPYLKDGKPTIDDSALQKLVRGTASRAGLRQAKLVQEIRGLQKLYGTYLDLEFDSDDRMRCSYNPRGTKYGRLSSSKTIRQTGTNFQNLPEEFKKFLVADPGYVFMEVDKRQAEWVVVAYATGDPNMIAAVESGLDVHTHTASLMFDVPPDIIKFEHKLNGHSTNATEIAERRRTDALISSITKTKAWPRTMSLRQCGKKSNHGLNYDESAWGFSAINEMELAEAKRIVQMYHDIYPGIRIWYEDVKKQLQADRTLINCFGRAVHFMGAWGDDLWKSAYSMIPQSTVVDSVNKGMLRIYSDNRICGSRGMNVDLLAQVHDSVLLQVPIRAIMERHNFEWLREKVRDYMGSELCYSNRTFQIASDYKFGLNWGSFDKEKNPGGMQEFEDYDTFMLKLKDWEGLNGQRTLGAVA